MSNGSDRISKLQKKNTDMYLPFLSDYFINIYQNIFMCDMEGVISIKYTKNLLIAVS